MLAVRSARYSVVKERPNPRRKGGVPFLRQGTQDAFRGEAKRAPDSR